MKIRIFLCFYLCATVLHFLPARENSSSIPLAPKTFAALHKLETDDQIQQAMERVKSINIKRYRSLKKLKAQNIPQFVTALSEFLYDNDPDVLRQQQKSLIQTHARFKKNLKEFSEKLPLEQDPNVKKQITADITTTSEKLIQMTLDQQEMMIKMKKQELALMETQLEEKKEHKNEAVQALVAYNTQKIHKF